MQLQSAGINRLQSEHSLSPTGQGQLYQLDTVASLSSLGLHFGERHASIHTVVTDRLLVLQVPMRFALVLLFIPYW